MELHLRRLSPGQGCCNYFHGTGREHRMEAENAVRLMGRQEDLRKTEKGGEGVGTESRKESCKS